MKHFFAVVVAFPILACVLYPVSAVAGCVHGNNSISGSIGPGQTDNSRSYTVDGTAILTVSGATDSNGDPVDLRVSFPGHCQQRSGPTVSCTVSDDDVVNAVIKNPGSRQVTYDWVCSSQ